MTGDPEMARPGGGRSDRRWLAVILLIYAAHLVYLGGLAEDAFISFRFARHLAGGHGLTWNVGEPPIEGYTNFLWVVLSALAFKLGLDVPRAAQALGAAAGAAAIVLSYLAGRRVAGWPFGVAIVPPLMLAAAGPFAAWSTSGMETLPFTALVLAGVVLFGEYWKAGRRLAIVGMGAALLAATLLRPEGALVFGLLAGLGAVFSFGQPRRRWIDQLLAAAVYLVPFSLYVVWRWLYFGDLLPNTFYAKTGGGTMQWLRGCVFAAGFAMQFIAPLVPWAMVAVWERGLRDSRAAGVTARVSALRGHALAAGSAAVFVGYTIYIVLVGGDYMAMHRFFVPVMPLLYLAAAEALACLAPQLGVAPRRRAFGVIVGLAVILTTLPSLPIESRLFFRSVHQHGNYRGVQVERWSVARLTLVGRFFDRYRKAPTESVATDAIGAVGYFADMPVYDFLGIVDRHIAHLPITREMEDGMAGHQKSDFPYILSKKPTYLMFSRFLTAAPDDGLGAVPAGIRSQVAAEYEARSVWLNDTANRESGYLTFLQRRVSGRSVY